jgi:beta-lactamase regulating signal transducer with metallopeptidase domain
MSDTLARALIAIGDSTEATILLKATLIMMVGLGATQLAGKARASVRHVLLASTFAAVLLLPLAVMLIPAAAIPIAVDIAPSPAAQTATPTPAASPRAGGAADFPPSAERSNMPAPTLSILTRIGWAAGCVWLVGSLGVSLWRLGRLRRFAYPWRERSRLVSEVAAEIGLRKQVSLALHEDVAVPITCGTRHPSVILPSDAKTWSDADVRRALVHEMEHVRRNDWAMQLAARAACAMYWFHPLIWKMWREFCLEAERACDDAVLSGADHADYADQLVQLARRMSSVSTVVTLTMASRSDLSTRVSAILDGAQKRGPVGMIPMTATATAAFLTAFALAPLRAVEMPRDSEPLHAQKTAQAPPPVGRVSMVRINRLDQALYEAAKDGDIDQMTALINAGANPNASIQGDGSPLMGAARSGNLAAVRFLLDRGVDPNLPVRGDGTALIVAARAGQAEVATLLLDRGADLEQVVPGDENALIQASGSGKLNVARLLVSRGANVNARVWADRDGPSGSSGEWRSPLLMAKRGGHQAVVEFLISSGAIE